MSSLNRLPNELINVILSYLPLPKIKELCSNSIINECDPIMLEFPGLPIYLKVYYDKKLTRLNYTLLLKQLRSSSLVYNNYFDLTYNSSTDVLIFASKNGHLEVVRLLLLDPKLDLLNRYDHAIEWARRYGYLEIVRLLKSKIRL